MPLYTFALKVPSNYVVQADTTEEFPNAAAARAHGMKVVDDLSRGGVAVPGRRLVVTDPDGHEVLNVPVLGE